MLMENVHYQKKKKKTLILRNVEKITKWLIIGKWNKMGHL